MAIGNSNALVIETPGHTRGHVSYLFPEDGIVFVGDTLFSVGCGKLLEGDAKTMWRSLQKLMALPPETQALLRPRIYRRQHQIRADCGARERGAASPRRRGGGACQAKASRRCRPRSRRSSPPIPSCVRRARRSRSGSAWRDASSGRSSARRASARTGFDRGRTPDRRRGHRASEARRRIRKAVISARPSGTSPVTRAARTRPLFCIC